MDRTALLVALRIACRSALVLTALGDTWPWREIAGLDPQVTKLPGIGLDIDTPSDISELMAEIELSAEGQGARSGYSTVRLLEEIGIRPAARRRACRYSLNDIVRTNQFEQHGLKMTQGNEKLLVESSRSTA